MGVIPYLIRSVVQLIFVVMDFVVIMTLVEITYNRWQFAWLKPFAEIVKPAVNTITGFIGTWLSQKTGKSYPEKTRILLLVLCLIVARSVICALL